MTIEDELRTLMRERTATLPPSPRLEGLHDRIAARRGARLSAAAVLAVALVVIVAAALVWPKPPPVTMSKVPTPPAPPIGTCVATALPQDPPNGVSIAPYTWTAIDPTGTVVAGEVPTGFRLWHAGRITTVTGVPGLHGDNRATVVALSAGGTVVAGYTNDSGAGEISWVWTNGRFTTLVGPPGAVDVRVVAMNTRGDLAGSVVLPDQVPHLNLGTPLPGNRPDDGRGPRAVVWPASAPGTVRLLPVPARHTSEAAGITEAGDVVGTVFTTTVSPRSIERYRWFADGSPDSTEPLPRSALGKVVSVQGDWALVDSGTRWNLRTGELDQVPAAAVKAQFIDRYGRVFGDVGGRVPSVWVNGKVSPMAMTQEMPWGLVHATTPDGRHILGERDAKDGPSWDRVVWTCG